MPQLARLLAQGLNQMRMRVSKRIHRHAGAEIEIAVAVLVEEVRALAAHERHISARIGGKKRREAHPVLRRKTDAALSVLPEHVKQPRGHHPRKCVLRNSRLYL